MFRKDISAHSIGFLIFTSSNVCPKRIIDLEIYLPESLWIEVKDHNQTYLICTTYRPPNSPVDYWERLNVCLEKAAEISNNIILTGDVNEDQLNNSNHKFRDLLSLNTMVNVITEPTRVTDLSQTLIDPIAISTGIKPLNSGVVNTDKLVSDHYGTYIYISIYIQPNTSYKRRVWNYKRADFCSLNNAIRATDWYFLNAGDIESATSSFITKF